MGDIFLLSLVAAANATLLAAVTVMLFLPSPKRLLLGYLAGALLISLSVGFVVVFVVHDSSATSTARSTVSPSIDIVFGAISLLVAYVLAGGHDQKLKERRKKKKGDMGRRPRSRPPRSSSYWEGVRRGLPSPLVSCSPCRASLILPPFAISKSSDTEPWERSS